MSFILDRMLKLVGLDPNTQKLSWTEVIVLGLVPAGQLYARIINFNGSLDKWWLMFPPALVAPLSFIPLLLMKFGFIQNGNGSNPIDKMMLLPIIAKFIIPFIMPYLVDVDSRVLTVLVSFIFKLLLVMVCNLYRRYDTCNTVTNDSIGKAGMDSVIATSAGDILPIAMDYIPIIGMSYSILSMVPIIGEKKILDSIFWTVGFGATYALLNMFNQLDIKKYCTTPFLGNLEDKTPFITTVLVLVGAHGFNYMMGGDLDEDNSE